MLFGQIEHQIGDCRASGAIQVSCGFVRQQDFGRWRQCAGQGNALIVMTNGPRISAYGSGSRFGWLHAYLDLPEAVPDLEDTTHGQAVSFEFLREADPDWLLVIDRVAAIGGEGASAQVTLDNALVREMRAWQQGRVIYLDAGALYIAGGGVQSILAALTTLRTAFDAEARVSE